MPIPKELLPQVLLAVGVAVFVFIMLRRSRGVFRRAEAQYAAESRGAIHHASKQRAGESESADYLRWQVEMHELARDVRAEIDTKLRALSTMQTLADKTLADLQRAIDEAKSLPPAPRERTKHPGQENRNHG